MAAVYLGEHKVLGSKVAIKVLHLSDVPNPAIERRFVNEAKAIAAIRHPGIVQLSDFGFQDGRAYIVMELLEGQTVSKATREAPLTEDDFRSFAEQTMEGMVAAQAQNLQHRDLKPANIL